MTLLNKRDRGNLTMSEIDADKNHTIVNINMSKTLKRNVLRKNNHFFHISVFALPNMVLKWLYYFIIIVTPFQFEYIIIPIILL